MIIDTSKMNEGQAAAMEVAESARDAGSDARSFAGGLFMGTFDTNAVSPFPQQSREDAEIGDDMVRRVSEYLKENLDPEAVDASREIPAEVLKELTNLGVFRMKVPKEYGGLGFSQVNYNRVMMAISSWCGSTAVLASAHQSIGVPQPLKMFGTKEQKDTFFPRLAEGAISAFALTEVEVGSDPARMQTKAELSKDGTHYIINGEKLWTTNGPIADMFVVMARTAPKVKRGKEIPQITAFIVEADTPGIEVVHRCDFMGLRAIQNGLIRFHDVKVPAENLLLAEGKGLKLALATLNTGRLTLPAACTGMSKQCLSIVRKWGKKREQWGQPVGRHEAGREKIAHVAATTFAMEAVTMLTSHWADEGRDIRIEAAMAKLFCSEQGWSILNETMQFRAGRGYERADSLKARGEDPWPVERMMRDGRINTIIEGTSDIMRLFLAREALDPHLKVAADLLRPHSPMSKKMKALGGMGKFYAGWYPLRLAGRWWSGGHGEMGSLARYGRFIERSSRRLATGLFHGMVRYQDKLERKQILLGHLMEIGTELFAMATTCAYAQMLSKEQTSGGSPEVLADLFCRQARLRILGHFKALRTNEQSRANRLAKQILDDSFTWMEEGVIPLDDAA